MSDLRPTREDRRGRFAVSRLMSPAAGSTPSNDGFSSLAEVFPIGHDGVQVLRRRPWMWMITLRGMF